MTDHNAVPDELLKQCERVLWRTLPSVIHATRKLSLDEEQDSKQLTPAQYHILRNIHRGSNQSVIWPNVRKSARRGQPPC